MVPSSVLVRDYICRVCGSHLIVKPDGVHCAADPVHCSWVKKKTAERWIFERGVTNWEILNDHALIEAIPGWPQPERPTVEQCYEELFG
jgi:hypothetical protein